MPTASGLAQTLGVMNQLARFDRFLFAKGEVDAMRNVFTPVLTNATLTRDEPLRRLLETHNKVSGIYFWILRHETKEYKIYIGQTNSLANRLVNYVSEFQAHSTNDYKLEANAPPKFVHFPLDSTRIKSINMIDPQNVRVVVSASADGGDTFVCVLKYGS